MKITLVLITLILSVFCGAILLYTTQVNTIEEVSLQQIVTQTDNKNIQYDIETIISNEESVIIKGWITNLDNNMVPSVTNITVTLKNDQKTLTIPTKIYGRDDLVKQLNIHSLKKNAGFSASFLKRFLEKGEYRLGILLVFDNKTFWVETDEKIII